jgi:hypothetical protein
MDSVDPDVEHVNTLCMYTTWDDFMADVTLLVENCIACVFLNSFSSCFVVSLFAGRYNKPESDLSIVAERIRKEAQEHISLIASQCGLSLNRARRARVFSILTLSLQGAQKSLRRSSILR